MCVVPITWALGKHGALFFLFAFFFFQYSFGSGRGLLWVTFFSFLVCPPAVRFVNSRYVGGISHTTLSMAL